MNIFAGEYHDPRIAIPPLPSAAAKILPVPRSSRTAAVTVIAAV